MPSNFLNQIGKRGLGLLQPDNSPIIITLVYDNYKTLIFPVNPEEIKRANDSSPVIEKIKSIGEIAIPQKPSLTDMMIESFFWSAIDSTPPDVYVNWLKVWQSSKKPAMLIITRFNFSMKVICTSFEYSIKAGEEGDVYFKLGLKEYKEYGAKLFDAKKVTSWFDNLVSNVREAFSYIAIPILPPFRKSNNNKWLSLSNGKYFVKKDESITSITKKFTGSTIKWRELIEVNRDIDDTFELSEGDKLYIPDSWLDGNSNTEGN